MSRGTAITGICAIGFSALLIAVTSCTRSENKSAPATPPTPEELATRGKQIYQTVCISCHNVDSKKPGSLGPEVHGASLELLTAKIMKAEYPTGYQPKRNTKAMAALPHLEKELTALHTYLNQ